MIYCELWGGVRMSNHCDVTFTEWGPPLPLILSTTAFDECTDWLLSGVPDYFGRNKISSGGDPSHYSSASLY